MSTKKRESPSAGGQFATTRWSVVLAAGRPSSPQANRALATLCETYWYPLYAFVRRQGYDRATAQDLTQGFFARLLEKEDLRSVRPDRGRFRSFLLASIKHFVINQWDRQQTVKRGGGRTPLSLDFDAAENRFGHEPTHDRTPEAIFDQQWAITLLDQVQQRLHQESVDSGKADQFEALRGYLTGQQNSESYRESGKRLGMSEGAVKVAVHRLRQRFRDRLRQEIAQTVASEAEIDEEIQDLFDALRC